MVWLKVPLARGFSKETYTEYLPNFHRDVYRLGVEEYEALKRVGELAYAAGRRLMENEELVKLSLELGRVLEEKGATYKDAIPYLARNHRDYIVRLYKEIPEIREILRIVAKFHLEPREILEGIDVLAGLKRPEPSMEEVVRRAVAGAVLGVGVGERPVLPRVGGWVREGW